MMLLFVKVIVHYWMQEMDIQLFMELETTQTIYADTATYSVTVGNGTQDK